MKKKAVFGLCKLHGAGTPEVLEKFTERVEADKALAIARTGAEDKYQLTVLPLDAKGNALLPP